MFRSKTTYDRGKWSAAGPEPLYLVARYVIACCAAEAVTVGFVVVGTPPYPDNTYNQTLFAVWNQLYTFHKIPLIGRITIESIKITPTSSRWGDFRWLFKLLRILQNSCQYLVPFGIDSLKIHGRDVIGF